MSAQPLRVEEAPAPYRVAPLLTDHIDTFASAPEGFKRLRELVLNLAVRGRLVKQSPGWKDTTLAHIGTWAIGSGFPHAAQGQTDLPILFAKVSDMNLPGNEVEIRSTNNTINEHTARSIRANIHPAGTVVFPKIGGAIATNKRRILIRPTAIDNNCLGITPSTSCSTAYLYLLLTSLDFTQYQAGTSVPALSQGVLGGIPVLLPPLVEQSRIVAKVEELMALIDALEAKVGAGETARGKLLDALLAALADSPDAAATAGAWAQLAPHFDLLLQTPADVDRLQQTLLQLAVKGRLVPQDPKDEPAAELLKRIRAEKERLIAEGKIKPEKSQPALEEPLARELPGTWELVCLRDLLPEFQNGASSRGCANGEKVVVLRLADIDGNEISLANTRELVLEVGMATKYALVTGDILIVRVNGSADIVGKFIPCSASLPVAYCDHFIRMRIRQDWISSDYLALVGRSRLVRDRISDLFITTAGQKTVNQGHIGTLRIPLPPLTEQSRIVATVASLTALCDRLRERLTARRALSAKLAASLTEGALS